MSEIWNVADVVTSDITKFLTTATVLGAVTMGIVEFFKTSLGRRGEFLEKRVKVWIGDDSSIVGLVFPNNKQALYCQPIDEFMERLRLALPSALDSPIDQDDLLRSLIKNLPDEDSLSNALDVIRGKPSTDGKEGDPPTESETRERHIILKRRLLDRMSAVVTSREVNWTYSWINCLRGTSVLVAFGLVLGSWALNPARDIDDLPAVFVSAFFIAMLAPFARDISKSIERYR